VRFRRFVALAIWGITAACGAVKGGTKPKTVPEPVLATSPRAVDSLWRVGVRLFNHGKWGPAAELLTRLGTIMPPTDPRLARLHFFQGEIEFAQGSELDAVRQFRRIADETPDDSLAPDALLRAGDAYMRLWKRPELDPTYGQTALSVYQEVGTRYPGTTAGKRAEVRVRELGERFALKEFRNAVFYYKFKAYDSAVLVLRSLIAQYPRAPIVPDALELLVQSYKTLGYQEDIKETCDYIGKFFPSEKDLARMCPKAAATDTAGKP
jgi:outer membrane assembly lipoprotein YfiO